MTSISAKQQAILNFIVNFIADRGYPPAISDISRHNGMCTAGVIYHLDQLEEKGALERDRRVARSLRVLSSNHPARESTLPAKEILRLYAQATRMILRVLQYRRMSSLEIGRDVFGGIVHVTALLDLLNAMRDHGLVGMFAVNEWEITEQGRAFLQGAS